MKFFCLKHPANKLHHALKARVLKLLSIIQGVLILRIYTRDKWAIARRATEISEFPIERRILASRARCYFFCRRLQASCGNVVCRLGVTGGCEAILLLVVRAILLTAAECLLHIELDRNRFFTWYHLCFSLIILSLYVLSFSHFCYSSQRINWLGNLGSLGNEPIDEGINWRGTSWYRRFTH